MTPERYRSRWTGREIDEGIASIKDKLDSSDIVHDFSGGESKVSSGELSKTLKTLIDQIKTPSFFQSLYLSIPNAALYTTALNAKLTALSPDFKGVFANASVRNSSLNTLAYTGKELCLLLDSGLGDGTQAFQYWSTSLVSWITVKLTNDGSLTQVLYPTIGTATFHTIPIANTDTVELTFRAKKILSNQYQAFSCLIGLAPDGVTTFINHSNDIGNFELITVSTLVSSGLLRIMVTTLATDVVVDAKIVAQL